MADRPPRLGELIRQGLSSLEGGYDQLAATFDRSVFRTPDPILKALVTQIPPAALAGRALDIGCGTGAVLQHLQPLMPRLVGLDLSRQMLLRARHNLGPQVDLLRGNFLRCYWEEAFTLITCVGVLGHIEVSQQTRFFRRCWTALRPGGSFVTVVGDLSQRPWLYATALAFDATMALRNRLWRPRFPMYYLNFVLPQAADLLTGLGFQVECLEGDFPWAYRQLRILRATRPSVLAVLAEGPVGISGCCRPPDAQPR